MDSRSPAPRPADRGSLARAPRFPIPSRYGEKLRKGLTMRITSKEWHAMGGQRNSYLYRKQGRGGPWRYYASDLAQAKEAAGRIADQESRHA